MYFAYGKLQLKKVTVTATFSILSAHLTLRHVHLTHFDGYLTHSSTTRLRSLLMVSKSKQYFVILWSEAIIF